VFFAFLPLPFELLLKLLSGYEVQTAMHIVQLTPGSGDNFYCENCLRDLSLVRALRALGHEVTLVPMYLPLQIRHPEPLSAAPIFFGGFNVYLQQKFSFFSKTPRWLDRWLDSPLLLRGLGKLSSMTRAKDLGETTLSMLAGRDGRQTKEIDRLVEWLAALPQRPDVILLSNALLSGLAEPLKTRLGVPTVCLLQDEDGFLDGLGQPWGEQAWQKLRENAADIDHFIAVSRYYRDVMRQRIALPEEKVSVIAAGVDTAFLTPPSELPDPPTIGYLARTCEDNGLDILVNALFMLRRDERMANVRLVVAGGSVGSDAAFLKKVRLRIQSQNLTDCVFFEPDFGREARAAFLRRLSVMAVPVRKPLACGLFAMEAMACGVPFVLPNSGAFAELAAQGGGILYEPNNPVHLAETLRGLLCDAERLTQLRTAARTAAETAYAVEKTAAAMAECLAKQIRT